MRKSIHSAAVATFAAAALIAGAGTAAAQTDDQEKGQIPERLLSPALIETLGSIGYGSLGTASLADLLANVINVGSTTLSVDVPNSTGSYAPGSLGSYGPEASIGEILTGSIGPFAGSI